MFNPEFTLAVAASEDGFIARYPGDPPRSWVSAEEQSLFFAVIAQSDWSIMGRRTHETADRADRRRIVFSRRRAGWLRPTQLWLDPDDRPVGELAYEVGRVHPLRRGLILGGTTVHDWFLARHAIDRVQLTVEPVTFGDGLPIFTAQWERDPVEAFRARGFRTTEERVLNARGTRLVELAPKVACA